jgi:hypothetical protein
MGTPDEVTAKIIDRIVKLRALATSSNIHEANAAAAAAAKLAAQHRIEEAEIEAATAARPGERMSSIDPEPVFSGHSIPVWKNVLFGTICEQFGCVGFVHIDHGPRKSRRRHLRVAGRANDVALVRHFFGWLTRELVAVASADMYLRFYSEHRRSWFLGAVNGIDAQMERARREAHFYAKTTALVHLDARALEARAVVEEFAKGKVRKDKRDVTAGASAQAFGAGYVAGHGLDLGGANRGGLGGG